MVHQNPQFHLAPPNSEALGGAIVIPRFSNNLFSGWSHCQGCGGGCSTKALLCIGKGLETILQVDLPLHEPKVKILEHVAIAQYRWKCEYRAPLGCAGQRQEA